MSLNVDTTTNSGVKTSVSSYNWTHVCTGGSLILVVGINVYDSTTIPTDNSVSGVTYNSVAMTKIASKVDAVQTYSSLWYLVNPTTGSNSVAVTLDNTYSRGEGGAISATSASQAGQADASGTFTATAQSPSNSITTISNNVLMVDSFCMVGSTTISGPVAGQTTIYNGVFSTGGGGMSYRTLLAGTPASYSMGWTTNSSHGYTQVIASILANHGSFKINSLRPHVFSPGLAR